MRGGRRDVMVVGKRPTLQRRTTRHLAGSTQHDHRQADFAVASTSLTLNLQLLVDAIGNHLKLSAALAKGR